MLNCTDTMKTVNLLKTVPLTGVALLAGCSGSPQKPQKPNVIIIYADDIGYGDLSCNGTAAVSTPNVDSLAEHGIRFTNSHTTSSVSTPSRYGLLTGQYPWRKAGTGIATGDAGMIIRYHCAALMGLLHSWTEKDTQLVVLAIVVAVSAFACHAMWGDAASMSAMR